LLTARSPAEALAGDPVHFFGPDGSQGVAAVKLRNPKYDRGSETLTYRAQPLENATSPGLDHLDDRLDREVPARFEPASLFIDSFHEGNTCVLFLKSSVNGGRAFESASKCHNSTVWGIGSGDKVEAP
jgi:hypothetical protein